MKTKITYFLLFFSVVLFLSNSSNPPNAKTGAPGDTGNCTQCHSNPNPNFNGSLSITSNGPTTVLAGNTYTITMLVNNPNMMAQRAGVQMVALDDASFSNAGSMSNPSNQAVITMVNSRSYVEHDPAINFSNALVEWTVEWTAPQVGELMDGDSIFFYGASVIADGSGTSGDIVRLSELHLEFSNGVPLDVQITQHTDPLCFDSNDGTALSVASGGIEPYTYLWDNGETNEEALMLTDGLHSVTVTDMTSSTATVDIMLNAPTEIQFTNEILVNPLCDASCEGSITVSVSGGSPNYTYVWTGPDGYSNTTESIDMLCEGNYTLEVTDNNNCSKTKQYTLVSPSEIDVTLIEIGDETCFGDQDGFVLINASGGTGTLSYNWSNNTTDQNLIGVPPGSYTLIVTDLNNCAIMSTYSVGGDPLFEVSIIQPNPIPCNGDITQLIAQSDSPISTYLWSNDMTSSSIDVIADEYSVTVTNSNGCEADTTVYISQPDALSVSFDVTEIINGNDGEISAIPNGGISPYTYLWNTGSMDSTISDLDIGTYTLTLTDSNQCELIESIVLQNNCDIKLGINSTSPNCFGDNSGTAFVEYEGNMGAVSFLWSNGETSQEILSLSAGAYSVTVTDSLGCSASSNIILVEPSQLEVDFQITDENNSTLGSISTTVTGGTNPYEYNWSTGGITSSISDLSAGTYYLTITDSLGCTTIDSAIVNLLLCNLHVSINATEIACYGDYSEVTATVSGNEGAYSIHWSDGNTDLIDTLLAGEHQVIVTDSLVCTDTLDFEITQPDLFEITEVTIEHISCDDTLGSIEIILGGGTEPYFTFWSNGDYTTLTDSLPLGDIGLTAVDDNGCEINVIYEILEINEDTISIEVDTINIYINDEGMYGGIPEILENQYILTGSCNDSLYLLGDSIFLDCVDLGYLNYQIELYNFNDLIDSVDVVINLLDTIPPVINCIENPSDIVSCGSIETILRTFVLDPNDLSDNCSATYFPDTLKVLVESTESETIVVEYYAEDPSGNRTYCTFKFEVIIHPLPELNMDIQDVSCFGESDGCIILDISGGTPPYNASENICDVIAGDYPIVIVDANSCEFETIATVNQPDQIVITEIEKGDETPGESDGFIDIDVIGGIVPYTYSWSDNGVEVSTSEDLVNFPASQYILTVTDSSGCQVILNTFIDMNIGITNESFDAISVFPVPFLDKIVLSGFDTDRHTFILTDILGNSMSVPATKGQDGILLQTDQLHSGIYFINIMDGTNQRSIKVVK